MFIWTPGKFFAFQLFCHDGFAGFAIYETEKIRNFGRNLVLLNLTAQWLVTIAGYRVGPPTRPHTTRSKKGRPDNPFSSNFSDNPRVSPIFCNRARALYKSLFSVNFLKSHQTSATTSILALISFVFNLTSSAQLTPVVSYPVLLLRKGKVFKNVGIMEKSCIRSSYTSLDV